VIGAGGAKKYFVAGMSIFSTGNCSAPGKP
jgi:hypothetical protein